MKFIRDIIGEKQIQSKLPEDEQITSGADCSTEPDDEWMLPPIDLAEGLDDDMPAQISASAGPAQASPTTEPTAPQPARSRPMTAPEASVIRRALWPDGPETEQAAQNQEDEANSDQDDGLPDPPRFGRKAYLDAIPEEHQAPDLPPVATPARGGRVKTRLLGFGGDMAFPADPIRQPAQTNPNASPGFPVGWLVIVSGPGRGTCFTLHSGVAQIGRGEGQAIRLDFGDTSISRENHAAIAFDPEQNAFFIGHGGKANLVRCNDMPVLATQELGAGDRLRIGETTLIFTPLCGPEFSWTPET